MRLGEVIEGPRSAAGERLGPRRALKAVAAAIKAIYAAGRGIGRWSERRARLIAKPPSAAAAGAAFAAGAATGAGGAYLLDPENGKRRRHVARDRLASFGRRGVREAERKSRYASGVAKGAVAEATGSD